jgi:transcription elongation factor Elf1
MDERLFCCPHCGNSDLLRCSLQRYLVAEYYCVECHSIFPATQLAYLNVVEVIVPTDDLS